MGRVAGPPRAGRGGGGAFRGPARAGPPRRGARPPRAAAPPPRLDHPAIASVLGAGDDEVGGRPLAWMAVEFVDDALPIHTYAESVGLGVHARVRLLRDVARAVEHAHAKGVLHRDLKPQNLLVASETGAPKVIDFGLARITERLGHADARRTRKGELLGTLAYMSPEQAAGDNERVDVRTDVYALGVVLYELLAGALPHELADLTLFDALKEVQRGILRGPRSVDPSLDADLDGIVRTAGAAEPSARYATAGALADDLDRWLDGRPVLARPPSSLHRLRLFARRRRPLFLGLVAGGALGAAGLTAIVSLSVENAARLREIGEQEEKVASARAELDEVGEIVGAIVARDARNILDAAGAESGTDEEKREAVRAALDELDRLRPLLDRDPESVPVLARTYGQLGDMRWTGWNMDAEDAETLWRAGVRSTELWRSALANAPESQEYERQMHASLIRVANAARRSSRTEEGLAYADECVSLARRMLARSPEDTAANDALIESLFARGDLFIPRRSAPQGLADGLESLALAEALKGDTPERRVKRFQTIAWAQLRLGFWILRERS
ncbi:MAG: serine/threonine-protein kinase, partial [Planctomycetota bacterium]